MSFSIKLNKSKNISFRITPNNTSITFTLTIPKITLSLRVKRLSKKYESKKYNSGTSYTPVNSGVISNLRTLEYSPYIRKISRLTRLNKFSNFLIPSIALSLLPNILIGLIDANHIISTTLNRNLFTLMSVSINLKILITLLLILIGSIGIILKTHIHTAARLEYEQLSDHEDIPSLWNRLANSDILWQVVGIYELDENASKENGGIGLIYERIPVKIRYKTPYYIRANSKVLQIKLDDYSLVILPEHYIIRKRSEVGIIEASTVIITMETSPYAELEYVPDDTEILYRTWKYVNKDGSKDKRYKDNKQIPICNYGLIHLEFDTGYKILLLSSRHE